MIRERCQIIPTTLLLAGLWLIPAGIESAQVTTIGVDYSSELGAYLVGEDGMTLYLFTPDEADKSVCYGGCATVWPPLIADSLDELALPDHLAGTFNVTQRDDGSNQVTYNGWPLYYWIADEKPGDATGHGVDHAWYVVNPAPTVQVRDTAEHGPILVDAQGITLYLFAPDEPGVSHCSGSCAINWPPLIVSFGEPSAGPGVGGELSLITRPDGAQQVAYNGVPLYGWINDQAPGDTTGHGIGDNWFVVNP